MKAVRFSRLLTLALLGFSLGPKPGLAKPSEDRLPVGANSLRNYLTTLAFTGPRLRDCRPGLDGDPGVYDKIQCGLLLVRWTGNRRLVHGTAHGHFKASELRLPAFFGTRPYYPEVHVVGHYHFPRGLEPSGFVSSLPAGEFSRMKPAVYSYSIAKTSGKPDLIYGYEFWPENFVDAVLASPKAKKAWRDAYDEKRSEISGSGSAAKVVPRNVASARFNSEHLSTVLGSEFRGTIARRFFSFQSSTTMAKMAWFQMNSKDPRFRGLDDEEVIGKIRLADLRQLLSDGTPYAEVARFVDPEARDAAQFGYDEVVLFGNAKMTKGKSEEVSKSPEAYFDILKRWVAAECADGSSSRIAFSPDYRSYIPFPGDVFGGGDALREEIVTVLIEAGERNEIIELLHAHSAGLLGSIPLEIENLISKSIDKARAKTAGATVKKLVDKSATKDLSSKEIGELRTAASDLLKALYCQNPRDRDPCCIMSHLDLP